MRSLLASLTLLQAALSRSREFEADATGARLVGDGRSLAWALAKLERAVRVVPMDVDPAQSARYIVNALTGRHVNFASLFMIHPATDERIGRLLSSSQGRVETAHQGGEPVQLVGSRQVATLLREPGDIPEIQWWRDGPGGGCRRSERSRSAPTISIGGTEDLDAWPGPRARMTVAMLAAPVALGH